MIMQRASAQNQTQTADGNQDATKVPVHINTLHEQFHLFAKFPEVKADGKYITLTKLDKWLIQAKILDKKNVCNTDTGVCFNKFRSSSINYSDFLKFLEELAIYKDIDFYELKYKLQFCGLPGTGGRQSIALQMKQEQS